MSLRDITWQMYLIIGGFMFLVVFILVFKQPITRCIDRIKQIKGNKFSIDTSVGEISQIETTKMKEEQTQEKSDLEEQKEIKEPKTIGDWRKEMFFAFMDHKRERADVAYNKIKELNRDVVSSKEDNILYLQYSHMIGDTDAIKKFTVFWKMIVFFSKLIWRLGFVIHIRMI